MNTHPLISASIVSTSMRALTFALATSVVIVLGGCASTPPPKEQMAVAEAAIKHATSTSTNENAAGELQLATDKLTSARDAMKREDYIVAKQLAEQVVVDAQVAELHAQTARSRKAAVETEKAAGALSTEMNRAEPK